MRDQLEKSSQSKKSYLSPKLVEYGSISKLTQTTGGTGADGGDVGMSMAACL